MSRESPEEYNQRKYGSSDPGPTAREVISIRSAEQEVAMPSFVPSITKLFDAFFLHKSTLTFS